MFIKIFRNERTDFIKIFECKQYSSVTSETDKHSMDFFIFDGYGNDSKEISIDKRVNYVYIENSNGKTVGNYKWHYDEKEDMCIRM